VDNSHPPIRVKSSGGAVVIVGSHMQNTYFQGPIGQKLPLPAKLRNEPTSFFKLTVVNEQEVPVSAQEHEDCIRKVIDDKLVDLDECGGTLPVITCSSENDQMIIDVDNEEGIAFVNDVLSGLNLTTIRKQFTWLLGNVPKNFFENESIQKKVKKINKLSNEAKFAKGQACGDQIELKLCLNEKDFHKLERKKLTLNCLSYGLVQLHLSSDL